MTFAVKACLARIDSDMLNISKTELFGQNCPITFVCPTRTYPSFIPSELAKLSYFKFRSISDIGMV
jgi:hypothetical protein